MLLLKDICKTYTAGDGKVEALKNVSIEFGNSEFVSVLGPSGCGKTTLLNIIGGLDRYTSGDLCIRGKSTKDYRDADWDTYRNHTIGFVFQSYNLIPHQSVLANVELALTLSGVSKSERRTRAEEALKKVGLSDQLKKRPNQLSGGQMQRVAIARALVNDPDIILADEPTGALDSETSVQVMELLKKVSEEKLVIMVTHNAELAAEYSTRIVRLLDGRVTSDEAVVERKAAKKPEQAEKSEGGKFKPGKKPTMSFFTATSLSMKNLLTKKGRTLLTSFAGSIGIIGIALILALSNGIQLYINRVQEDTLASYPLQISEQTVDMTQMLQSMSGSGDKELDHELDAIYTNSIAAEMLNNLISKVKTNNLESFMEYIETNGNGIKDKISSVQYVYGIEPQIYRLTTDAETGIEKALLVNPSNVLEQIYGENSSAMTAFSSSNMSVWNEMLDDEALLRTQYDCINGKWPENYNEVVLVVDENNEISDMVMYALGIKDSSEIADMMQKLMLGEPVETEEVVLSYEDILGMKFRLVPNSSFFEKSGTITEDGKDFQLWTDKTEDAAFGEELAYGDTAIEVKIVGILRPSENAVSASLRSGIGYTSAFTRKLIEAVQSSEIAVQQTANPERSVLTGNKFGKTEYTEEDVNAFYAALPESQKSAIEATIAVALKSVLPEGTDTESEAYKTYFGKYLSAYVIKMMPALDTASYATVCKQIGIVDLNKPTAINIYAKTFDEKEEIADRIALYNKDHADDGKAIEYTDYVALLMSSVTKIVNFVSYALIAFVSISLIVSSIMIGIITYISVLERTKEIGVLRSIGASKRDISRVFNAETLLVGFASGVMGILATLLLTLPLNLIIGHYTDIWNIASLPVLGAVILVVISMLLTVLAGLVPSVMASMKDPVVALRSE